MDHLPVLVKEVVELLGVKEGDIYLDCTIGGGGHGEAILEASGPDGKLIGMDRDEEAIRISKRRLEPYGNRVRIIHTSFSKMERVLESCEGWVSQAEMPVLPLEVDGILFDLGLSSFQIDTPERGFSYLREGPLDMRMDQSLKRTARDLVNEASVESLEDILRTYGEERFSKRIARAILRERRRRPVEGTLELAEIIRGAVPKPKAHKSLARVFQSLRIFLNEELEELREGLSSAFHHLKPGGRVGVISYHSLEDRIVKEYFRSLAEEGKMRPVTKKVVKPSLSEIERNRRARGARLRVGEKVK